MSAVYMKVSKDKYRLPVAIADSPKELAELCGSTRNTILSAISKAKQRKQNSIYLKVEIDDEEWNNDFEEDEEEDEEWWWSD